MGIHGYHLFLWVNAIENAQDGFLEKPGIVFGSTEETRLIFYCQSMS
jgi:hypothetical protein